MRIASKKDAWHLLRMEKITLAGGCFWGVEELFRKLPGVIMTEVGYAGGHTAAPTYNDVKTGSTGHAEVIQVTYDPGKTSLAGILTYFFKIHDPTTPNRQGNDIGSQYRSEIFCASENQKNIALEVIKDIEDKNYWDKPVVTKVSLLEAFYSAEDFHQDYLQKNPGGYTCHFERKF